MSTPFDLIQDKINTFSDIGHAIELDGFKLESARLPLAKGLIDLDHPTEAIAQILDWTGGQPFLTQKLCQLVVQKNPVQLQQLVQTHIVERWEFQDEHEHLKTIRNRLLSKEHLTIKMLNLYQEILRGKKITADNSLEQMELRLSGLVVKQENCLRVYNKIYQSVFNLGWVEQTLSNLRPYTESLKAWQASNDESWLLKERQLETAFIWAADKSLGYSDYQFLAASQELEKLEAQREATEIFKLKTQQAEVRASQIVDRAQQKAKRKIKEARRKIRRNSVMFVLGTSLAGVAIATGLIQEARNRRKIEQIKAFNLMSENYLNEKPNRQLEALLASDKAGKQLQQTLKVPNELKEQTTSTLQKVVDKIEEYNRLEGDRGSVDSVSFSRDGQTIATASANNSIKLWNIEGQLLKTFKGHTDTVYSVSFSPDGQTIATAGWDYTVRLWSRDGTLLKTIKLWNPNNTLLATLTGHLDRVKNLSFSPDGQTIASASEDGTVRIWQIDRNLPIIFQGHKDEVHSVSFSPSDRTFVSVGSDKMVILWNLNNTKIEQKWFSQHQRKVVDVGFSPDGQTIATASDDGTAKLWEPDGTLLSTSEGHQDEVNSVSFSPDGQTIATASDDKTVKL